MPALAAQSETISDKFESDELWFPPLNDKSRCADLFREECVLCGFQFLFGAVKILRTFLLILRKLIQRLNCWDSRLLGVYYITKWLISHGPCRCDNYSTLRFFVGMDWMFCNMWHLSVTGQSVTDPCIICWLQPRIPQVVHVLYEFEHTDLEETYSNTRKSIQIMFKSPGLFKRTPNSICVH